MDVWILERPVEGGIVRLSPLVSYTYCLELIEVPNMVYRISALAFVATTATAAAAVALCLCLYNILAYSLPSNQSFVLHFPIFSNYN